MLLDGFGGLSFVRGAELDLFVGGLGLGRVFVDGVVRDRVVLGRLVISRLVVGRVVLDRISRTITERECSFFRSQKNENYSLRQFCH